MRLRQGLKLMNSSMDEFSPRHSEPNRTNAVDSARLLGSMVFYSLLALIAFVAVPYGSAEPWWEAIFECAIFMLATLWLVEGFLSRSWNFSGYHVFLPLLILAAFALIQTFPIDGTPSPPLSVGGTWQAISADPHGTRRWIGRMLSLILAGAMLLRYTHDRKRLRALMYVVIGIGSISAIFGLLRQMTQHSAGFFLPNLTPGYGYGQFINKNHFAFLMELALGPVLGLIVWGALPRERLLVSFAIVLLLGGALVSANSRGGILGLFCQFLFTALLFSGRRSVRHFSASGAVARSSQRFRAGLLVRAVLIVCFIGVIAIGTIWVGGAPLVSGLEAMPTEVGAQTENTRLAARRWDIWAATWHLIKDHPVAGVGFGGYWMDITAYHDVSGEMTPQEAHNDYLEFIASGGLIGVAIGTWFLLAYTRRVRQRLRDSDRFIHAARYGALVGITGVAIHSLVDFGLHITINAVIFMVLLVIASADVSVTQSSRRGP
jgi:O-antigen ligase